MRFIPMAITALLALAGCTNEPRPESGTNPAPEQGRDLTFLVQLPSVGKVEGKPVSYAAEDDPLAIKDESRLRAIYVYVFGLNPDLPAMPAQPTTDHFILEGIFPFEAPDVSSPAGQTNAAFATVNDIRVEAGIKHLYFVGNDQVAIADGAPETHMINALASEGRSLPIIDTIPFGGGEREVKAPGIPMSTWAYVDASNIESIEAPDVVVLQRSIARLDVINATIDYYITGAQLRAYGRGYLFDTIALLQPAGMVWNNPADYTHITGAWNSVPMPRTYDWVFSQPVTYDLYPLMVPPRSNDPLADTYEAKPVAAGYIFPTPPRTDIVEGKRAIYATLFLLPVDTLQYIDWPDATQPNPNYGLPVQHVQPMQIDIPFERSFSDGTIIFDSIKRNHVYRVAIKQNPDLEAEFIVVDDWTQAQGSPVLRVPVIPSIDFRYKGNTLANIHGDNYCYRIAATPEHDTIDVVTLGLTPHLVEHAHSPLPVWLTLGAQVGDGATPPTDAIFVNLNEGIPDADPRWILEIAMQENTSGVDRTYSLYVRVGEKPNNPSTLLTIIQHGS